MPDQNAYKDAQSAYAPRGATSSAKSATITCTSANTDYSSALLTEGVYMLWVKSGLRADVLSFVRGATSSASLVPASGTAQSVHEMPGDWVESVRVTAEEPYVWVSYTLAGAVVQLTRVGD